MAGSCRRTADHCVPKRNRCKEEIIKINVDALNLPAKEWQAYVDKLTPQERIELATNLIKLVTLSTQLGTYVGNRGGYGDDKGHDEAIHAVNRLTFAVRKAIGSYPFRLYFKNKAK